MITRVGTEMRKTLIFRRLGLRHTRKKSRNGPAGGGDAVERGDGHRQADGHDKRYVEALAGGVSA
jgi:hypothetical protein